MRACVVIIAVASVGCATRVDLDGPTPVVLPALATVGTPRAFTGDPPPPGTSSACLDDACLVPSVGLVTRSNGELVGGTIVNGSVAADGDAFYSTDGDGGSLVRITGDGALTSVGGELCSHLAWTGRAIVASCRDGIVRYEDGQLVRVDAAPFAEEGAELVGLVGVTSGALAVGTRAHAEDDEEVLVRALDADGRLKGPAFVLASSPFAAAATALAVSGRTLVAWPDFGDPFPRVVTHVAVLDRLGNVVVAPHAPLPESAAGLIASDGTAWTLFSIRAADSEVRAVRITADGELVSDLGADARDGAITLGDFTLDSVVGIPLGPCLLLGGSERRVLRFVEE